MHTFEPTTFENWKNDNTVSSNKILIDFAIENKNLFEGYLVGNESIYSYTRFKNISEIVDFLKDKLENGYKTYLHSIEYTHVFTPENYTEEQRFTYEREKHNFSGKYSEEFTALPKVSLYTLKSFSKKKIETETEV
jgi:hypothetical protein